jgi:hypothetical protein
MAYEFIRVLEQPVLLAHSGMSESLSFKKRLYKNNDAFQTLSSDIVDGRISLKALMDACVFYKEKLFSVDVKYNVFIEEMPIYGLYILCIDARLAGLNVDDQMGVILETMVNLPRNPMPAVRDIICRGIVENIREELNKLPEGDTVDRGWTAVLNAEHRAKLVIQYE